MSASENQAVAERSRHSELNDEIVSEYLKNHDDFLQRNPEMLDYLHITHASGSAVSLVEKQASVLRERNTALRQQLKTLTANARANDALFRHTRALVITLLDVDSLESLYSQFMRSLARDFEIEHVSMIIYSDEAATGWRAEPMETVKNQIGGLFKGHKAVCGTLRKEELRFLFPEGTGVGSAALVPLADDKPIGLIAVGSSDANRYNSTVDTLFLSHIADVLQKLMSRLPGTR
ncbi:MAG: DUF484 family protein [Halioglobus sp.]|nr:DUF484 family protein [Halioglobus sp.]